MPRLRTCAVRVVLAQDSLLPTTASRASCHKFLSAAGKDNAAPVTTFVSHAYTNNGSVESGAASEPVYHRRQPACAIAMAR